ncbi:MAG: hypothetical protein HY326_08515 [Chloroflexi bacterium]|nr:hypothetical protein [Chloroflexota bacterium]
MSEIADLPELETECPLCKGKGEIYSPAWAEYKAESSAWYAMVTHPAREAADKPPPPDEDEMIPCPECNGHRTILTGAGQQVMQLVQRALVDERRFTSYKFEQLEKRITGRR